MGVEGKRYTIYLSVDLEGLPGISGLSQVAPGYSLYNDAREIMTWAVNVFSDAFLSNGATEVLVADSHGYMNNLEYMKLIEGTRILQGYPRPYSMVLGVEEADAAAFVGYHSAAGTLGGFLDHTYSSRTIYRVFLNGRHTSEFLLNALYAGENGVPIILVAGDEALEREVKELAPWIVFVPLKKGVARLSAWYEDRPRVESRIWKSVQEAMERLERGEARLLTIESPLNLRIELRDALYADMAQLIPGARRVSAYTIEYTADKPSEALAFVELVAWIGGSANALVQGMRGS